MDFFNTNATQAALSSTVDATEFAAALQNRQTFVVSAPSPRMVQALSRSTNPAAAITNSASTTTTIRPNVARANSKAQPSAAANPFKSYSPHHLAKMIDVPGTLVLDVRPHGHWRKQRIRKAINIAVPSTLLRRPAFSLEKITTMLPTASDKEAFSGWASAKTIVVYDADYSGLVDSSNVVSLLAKLKVAGASAELAYLCGGINGVLASDQVSIVDASSPDESPSTENGSLESSNQFLAVTQLAAGAFQQGTTTGAAQRPSVLADAAGAPGPSTNRMAASNPFYDNIRQHMELAGGITERIPLYIPRKVLRRKSELPFEWLRTIALWAGGLPSNTDSHTASGTGSEVSFQSSGYQRRSRVNAEEGMEALAMQFYRIELGEQRRLQGVMDMHSRESGQVLLPTADKSAISGTGANEPESNDDDRDSADYFPFSITAGIEKGDKNRYKNIWPFDHARVRLQNATADNPSDYINASYIQPRGTNRQYIATQGPMPSTFDDFWMLTWEQNVRILVMLTKRMEGHSIKCGLYWKDGSYGPINLKLVKEEGGTEGERAEENSEGMAPVGGFDFNVSAEVKARKARRAKADMERQIGKHRNQTAASGGTTQDPIWDEDSPSSEDEDDSIIRREFHIWHENDPTNVRTIVQFQYVGWPDLSAPTSPRYLLKLIKEIDILYEEYTASGIIGTEDQKLGGDRTSSAARFKSHTDSRAAHEQPSAGARKPVRASSQILVHCSAGVGRTGSFVLVDAILEALRRETRKFLRDSKVPGDHPEVPAGEDMLMELDDLRDTLSEGSRRGDSGGSVSGGDPTESMGEGSLVPEYKSEYGAPSLPELESLSMRAMFSTSPPNPSSLAGSSRHPSMLASTAPTPSTNFTSPLPPGSSPISSLPQTPFAASLLQRRKQAGMSTTDASATLNNPMSSNRTLVDSVVEARHVGSRQNAPGAGAFEFMSPRQINVPRHARKHHPQSQMAKLAIIKEDRRKDRVARHGGKEPEQNDGDESSPPDSDLTPLSSMDEPVRQVLEAIREQRMSMCQSLRQYVFVHRAILEGAMQMLDELRSEIFMREASGVSITETPNTPMELSSPQKEVSSLYEVRVPKAAPVRPSGHSFSLSNLGSASDLLKPTSISGLGKRLASPTELLRTDVSGAHTISKRPSLKRINHSTDVAGDLQLF